MHQLTVVICTHNRAQLLEKALASLNQAARPETCSVEILVIANACSDRTHELLASYGEHAAGKLPLRWVAEPAPGKSHALNRAISLVTGDIVTFVDDDHRVDHGYLVGICAAASQYPKATMFCGRILPDWDGTEPAWVHDEGRHKIRPLPIPRSDGGPLPKQLSAEDAMPGGGNLFLRREVFDRVGGFSTDLGPRGHDLGGGEDTVFLLNALGRGETLQYVPDVVQHHYVDQERLRLGYLLAKAYQRARFSMRARASGLRIPLYMWRKLGQHLLGTVFSLNLSKSRYHLVRSAATLGEMHGIRARLPTGTPPVSAGLYRARIYFSALLSLAALGFSQIPAHGSEPFGGVAAALAASTGIALLLGIKSLLNFSRSGPRIRDEVWRHYRFYAVAAFFRLLVASWGMLSIMSGAGVVVYASASTLLGLPFSPASAMGAGVAGILAITALQFCRHLLLLPASLAASAHYRMSRLYPLWRLLSPSRLNAATGGLTAAALILVASASVKLMTLGRWDWLVPLGAAVGFYGSLFLWLRRPLEPSPVKRKSAPDGRPNVLLIGSDTLRADRLDGTYRRDLTPFIDRLKAKGSLFTHCYVPCARTAPSLISLLTGVWPHRHGVRDNFVADAEIPLQMDALPQIFRRHGYYTAGLSDWSGADMAKYPFGFEYLDVPEDQWNIKLYIRQGPKDLRLFLSLFTHNAFGKFFLPEIHYLGGIPLTDELGIETRRLLNYLAQGDKPFFLNAFFSTTHGPFGSEYPYYGMFSEPDYAGESKFAMARVADPFDIIRRQGEPREEFDLDQIINLYDSCVRRFDDEVARIVRHLEACGLAENTIIALYSDHGMEFFEHDTWGQGNSAVGEASSRVPLLIVDPRRSTGRQLGQAVRSIDLAPTLLELAGLPPHPGMDGASLRGRLDGIAPAEELPAYNETGIWLTSLPGMPENHLRYPDLVELLEVPDKKKGTLAVKAEYLSLIVAAKDRMIRSGQWKLVYQPLTNGYLLKLFDLSRDPECRHDTIKQEPDVARQLWTQLQRLIKDDTADARFRSGGGPVDSSVAENAPGQGYEKPEVPLGATSETSISM